MLFICVRYDHKDIKKLNESNNVALLGLCCYKDGGTSDLQYAYSIGWPLVAPETDLQLGEKISWREADA